MDKSEQSKNIVTKYQSDIISGFDSILWDIWNDLDNLIEDIQENNISKTEICNKLTQICNSICG